jgi:large subunit ribosomal protein L23
MDSRFREDVTFTGFFCKKFMQIVKNPLSTEKSIKLMEAENKLIFAVDKKATKEAIKKEIESFFKVKVVSVTTRIGPDAKKRAYVRFSNETPAIDIATQLGLI